MAATPLPLSLKIEPAEVDVAAAAPVEAADLMTEAEAAGKTLIGTSR